MVTIAGLRRSPHHPKDNHRQTPLRERLFFILGAATIVIAIFYAVTWQAAVGIESSTVKQDEFKLKSFLNDDSAPPGPLLLPGLPVISESLDYSVIKKCPLVVADCVAEGKRPILIHQTDIIDWVCKSEKHVTKAMLYVFGQYAFREEKGLMLDVGANTGYYSLLAASFGHNAIQFDLQLECLKMLRNSVIANGFSDRVSTIAAGISETLANISVPSSGCDGRFPAVVYEQKKYGTFNTSTPVFPLNSVLNVDEQEIMLMKVDTEGNEKRVLVGAFDFFERRKIRNAIVEVTPGEDFWKNEGITADEVINVLSKIYSLGYRIACLDNSHLFGDLKEMEEYIRKPFKIQMDFWVTLDEEVLKLNSSSVDEVLSVGFG